MLSLVARCVKLAPGSSAISEFLDKEPVSFSQGSRSGLSSSVPAGLVRTAG